jgi:Pectate lyase superfamily protein
VSTVIPVTTTAGIPSAISVPGIAAALVQNGGPSPLPLVFGPGLKTTVEPGSQRYFADLWKYPTFAGYLVIASADTTTVTVTTYIRGEVGAPMPTSRIGDPNASLSANAAPAAYNMLKNLPSFNVDDYGTAHDGVTDDTAVIADVRAIAAIAGGIVRYGPYTYVTNNQQLYANVHDVGAGINATILLLTSGANNDLFSGQTSQINLAAASGAGIAGTIYNFSIQDMTLDGNKANNSGTSWCCRVYAYGYILHNVRVRNGFSGGILSDWNGSGGSTLTPDSMESQFTNVKIHSCSGPGLEMGGPHDTQSTNLIIYDCLNPTYNGTGSLTPGLHVAPNCAGFQVNNIHVWSCNLSILCESNARFANTVAECTVRGSNAGTGVAVLSGGVAWAGGTVFASSGSGPTETGFVLGQVAGGTPLSPYQVTQSAGLTTAVSITEADISDVLVQGTQVAAFAFANVASSRNAFSGIIRLTAGAAFTGTLPGGGNQVNLSVSGITPDPTLVLTHIGESATAVAQTSSTQIATTGLAISRVNPAGNITGNTLQSGTAAGQQVIVRNESAFTVTFAASSSHVADANLCIILANREMLFHWSVAESLWYHC